VREFRGVVQNESGAVIPHAKIRVLRKSSDKEDLAKIQSDEKGQFSLRLDRGTYLAVFQIPGFKNQVLGLKVANDGWDAFRLTMEIVGTATNVPPEMWEPAK
ncbi:MAG: carboxypeptidase-like regulatory domain-containing protein, partial [Candidatus Sulfotelmatobacter sp.]